MSKNSVRLLAVSLLKRFNRYWFVPLLILPGMATANDMSAAKIEAIVHSVAQVYQVDPWLVLAVIETESSFNHRAVSPKGAVGLMQVIPATAQRFGIEPNQGQTIQQTLTDPFANILAGTLYLAYLDKKFQSNLELMLAAYNAGEGVVKRYGNQVPPYPETERYIKKVLRRYSPVGEAISDAGSTGRSG